MKNKGFRCIYIDEVFDIPSGTKQMRKLTRNGASYPTKSLQYARAAWQAMLEKHRPEKPLKNCHIYMSLAYHTEILKRVGQYKTTKPDLDNIMKVAMDAMVSAGLIENDESVHHIDVRKIWTRDSENVYIEIVGE